MGQTQVVDIVAEWSVQFVIEIVGQVTAVGAYHACHIVQCHIGVEIYALLIQKFVESCNKCI